MFDRITIAGLVATTPRHLVTQDGLPITSFRLAASQRRFDRFKNVWVDAETNWYTITAFKQVAINVNQSISKGDRIVVTGTVRVRDWDNGSHSGTSVEIEVENIGHDLAWGTSTFTRTVLVREDLRAPSDMANVGSGNFANRSWVSDSGEFGTNDLTVFDSDFLTPEQWDKLDNLADSQRLPFVRAVLAGDSLEAFED